MRKTISGTTVALSIALAVLTGCSHDRSQTAASSGSSSSPVLPADGAAASPGGATAGPGAAAGATAGPGAGATAQPTATASPSRPDGRRAAPINSAPAPWIQGTVTRGGPGPCYGFTATNGVAYAVYSPTRVNLTAGQRVRARLTPGRTPVNCGSGKPARLERLQIAG
jgi:hypothetical protein